MWAPGTMPISMRRRAIAHDPCTLTTRAATPEGSVSSDPGSPSTRLDFCSFFLNSSRSCQAKLKIAFNSIQDWRATGAPHCSPTIPRLVPDLSKRSSFFSDGRLYERSRSGIDDFEDGFAVAACLTDSSFLAPACGILRTGPTLFRNKPRSIVRERPFLCWHKRCPLGHLYAPLGPKEARAG